MLDSLEHFLLIVEHGTFTEASRHAHLSQPALTASIRRLEDAFGARLLERGRRGARPTAQGEALIPRARAALAAIDSAKRAVREVDDLSQGEVRLAAGATACTYLLPPSLAAFRAQHPGVRLILRESTAPEALDALDKAEIDVAVVTAERGVPWFEDELVLVAAPGVDATSAPFVSFRSGSTTRRLLERHFPEADVVMELGGIASVKTHARMGVGVALVSRHSVATDLALGRLRLVDDPRVPLRRPLRIVHGRSAELPPAAAALRDFLLAEPARVLDDLDVGRSVR